MTLSLLEPPAALEMLGVPGCEQVRKPNRWFQTEIYLWMSIAVEIDFRISIIAVFSEIRKMRTFESMHKHLVKSVF